MSKGKVKVWNDNVHPYETLFKGDKVSIPSKSFIEMDFFEAHEFKGQYHPIFKDASGLQDPKSYKMIRIEEIDTTAPVEKAESHRCMRCNHVSPSPEELTAHMSVRHAEEPTLEIAELDEKPKRGRPAKSVA